MIKPEKYSLKSYIDNRGIFSKVSNNLSESFSFFKNTNIQIFYSVSKKNVIRGFHYQVSPHDSWKFVYCSYGKVIDFCLNLKVTSQGYELFKFILEDTLSEGLLIPPNYAHAFEVCSDIAIINYIVEKPSNSNAEKAINPLSFTSIWKSNNPIISKKDLSAAKVEDKFWIST